MHKPSSNRNSQKCLSSLKNNLCYQGRPRQFMVMYEYRRSSILFPSLVLRRIMTNSHIQSRLIGPPL